MAKFKNSQLLTLSLIAALLFLTLFLSSSLRSTFLYFIINILIISLGAEAGLLSSLPKPSDDKRQATAPINAPNKPAAAAPAISADKAGQISTKNGGTNPDSTAMKPKVVEKSASEKFVTSSMDRKVKRCPSMPSLFFIGDAENEAKVVADRDKKNEEEEEEEEEAEAEEIGGISGQELFAKAESFIGDFYRQLKMQREESWNRIHGF
ncbi:hypothetical protein Nepgr_026838 [Nepenthes gracilis]|uniref:DUF4408 domain-containing protein n=1 Tax=Nepenthes gracilis TaxID=150966 RepID=A0AAD3T7J9_NEPGR|nr:hypothetical protein Nepgr_026838 [Nepenthes gracilis]